MNRGITDMLEKKAAATMKNQNLCLEEYLKNINNQTVFSTRIRVILYRNNTRRKRNGCGFSVNTEN